MATTGVKYATRYLGGDSRWSYGKNITDSNYTNYGSQGQGTDEQLAFIAGYDFSSIPDNAAITGYTVQLRGCGNSTLSSRKFTLGYQFVYDVAGRSLGENYGRVTSYTEIGEKHYFTQLANASTTPVTYSYTSQGTDSGEIQWMNQHLDYLKSGNFSIGLPCANAYVYWVTMSIEYSTSSTITTDVTPSGSGSVSGGGSYASGATATLTATPSTGHRFVQWQDGNTSNPRTITVSGDATYTATFALNSYTVSTDVSPSWSGSVSGGGTYNHGANATLTATPAIGYQFVKWSDGNTSNPRTVTVTAAATYTATFALKSYVVSTAVSPSGSGTVTGAGTYNHGSTATLTATPATGYEFVKWSDNNTSSSRTVTVTAAATYTATFQLKTYTIYLKDDEGNLLGSVTATHGSSPVITATPTKQSSGGATYTFREWNTEQYGGGTAYALNELPEATKSVIYYAQFDVTYATARIISVTTTPNPVASGQGFVITVVFEEGEEEEEEMAYRVPFTVTNTNGEYTVTTTSEFSNVRTAVLNDKTIEAKVDFCGMFTAFLSCRIAFSGQGVINTLIFSGTVPMDGNPKCLAITWNVLNETNVELYTLETLQGE